jgi:acetyltransferase
MDGAIAPAPYRIYRYPSALIDRVVLDDGRTVTVRPVLPQDAEAEQTFVAALSPATRRERFHLAVNALPDALLRHFTEIDYRSHVALIAEALDDDHDEPILVADARYVVRDDGVSGEFAIVVADAWQGNGIGRLLLTRLARVARRNGLRELSGDVLVGNDAMQALVRGMGGEFVTSRADASLMWARILL